MPLWRLEPTTGLEPVTSSLPRKCSTTELGGQCLRAGDRIRTGDVQLGRLTLYQLSYSRDAVLVPFGGSFLVGADVADEAYEAFSVEGDGFEPSKA